MIVWSRPILASLTGGRVCAYAHDTAKPSRHVFAIGDGDEAALAKVARYMRMGGSVVS